MRRTGRRQLAVLKVDEFRNKKLPAAAGFKTGRNFSKIRFIYVLPAILPGKAEVYLDEANLVAMV